MFICYVILIMAADRWVFALMAKVTDSLLKIPRFFFFCLPSSSLFPPRDPRSRASSFSSEGQAHCLSPPKPQLCGSDFSHFLQQSSGRIVKDGNHPAGRTSQSSCSSSHCSNVHALSAFVVYCLVLACFSFSAVNVELTEAEKRSQAKQNTDF